MKTIVYRGGVIRFRIPARWREEYSDMEGGMFYEDRPNSGTLRLRIITMSSPKELESHSAIDVLYVVQNSLKGGDVKGKITSRKDRNALLKYEQATSEHGRALMTFNWIIANPLPPGHARVATFSYTALAEQRNRRQLQRELEMLEAEIGAARFSPTLGVVSG